MTEQNPYSISHLVALADKSKNMPSPGTESRLLAVIKAQQKRIKALRNIMIEIERNTPSVEPDPADTSRNYARACAYWYAGEILRNVLSQPDLENEGETK